MRKTSFVYFQDIRSNWNLLKSYRMSWKLAELKWRQDLGLYESRWETKSTSLPFKHKQLDQPLENTRVRNSKYLTRPERQDMRASNSPLHSLGNHLHRPDIDPVAHQRSPQPASRWHQHPSLSRDFSTFSSRSRASERLAGSQRVCSLAKKRLVQRPRSLSAPGKIQRNSLAHIDLNNHSAAQVERNRRK